MSKEIVNFERKRIEKEVAQISATIAATTEILIVVQQRLEELYISLDIEPERLIEDCP